MAYGLCNLLKYIFYLLKMDDGSGDKTLMGRVMVEQIHLNPTRIHHLVIHQPLFIHLSRVFTRFLNVGERVVHWIFSIPSGDVCVGWWRIVWVGRRRGGASFMSSDELLLSSSASHKKESFTGIAREGGVSGKGGWGVTQEEVWWR